MGGGGDGGEKEVQASKHEVNPGSKSTKTTQAGHQDPIF